MHKDSQQTYYRVELKQRIMEVAMHEFLGKGIKQVKMDDIANTLAISKRTLYEIFSNKEELLLECVRKHEDEYDQHMSNYGLQSNHSVIDIIIEFYRLQVKNITDATPEFCADLDKYANVVDFLNKRRFERQVNASQFFKKGVEEGYFRQDVDYGLALKLGTLVMESVMKHKLYEGYPLAHVFFNIAFLFIRGLCTIDGIKEIDRLIGQEDLLHDTSINHN